MLSFRVVRNMAIYGTELLSDIEEKLRKRLPASWRLELRREPSRAGVRPDALLEIQAPSGQHVVMAVECKTNLQARDVPLIVERMKPLRADGLLVAAPFIGPRAREVLAQAGAGYADATGNIRLSLDTPPLFIELAGAESNPWREGEEPLRTLKGPGAGRVVRGLCELRPPYGIRELAKRCGAPASTTSRVVGLLDRDSLLNRNSDGRIASVNWPGLVRRWVQDYSLARSNRTRMYLEPRGLPSLLAKLRNTEWTYAVTASLAAVQRAPVAAPRLAVIYVADATLGADRLQLKPAESGANVMLAEPFDRVVFERTWQADGITYTGLAQVAADLLTSPGRAPSEGEELIRWMETNEDAWRA